jgi:hypothetical protein
MSGVIATHPAATHESCEVLRGAPAGDQAERRLELREDRRLPRREAHVAGQHELAAGARTRPSICAIVTRRLAVLRDFVRSTWEMK